MPFRATTGFLFCFLISSAAFADELRLNPSHPDRYTVVEGDTLWDISGLFLKEPWKWPSIWRRNPQIKNPDLIYPGDTITLTYNGGKPQLTLQRGGVGQLAPRTRGHGRLAPRIREVPLQDAIPVIPVGAIKQFLSGSRVVSESELADAPYIAGFAGEHISGGAGQKVYVLSIENDSTGGYTVFRPGQTFKDPDTGDILGYEALYIGSTQLVQTGDPATLLLTQTSQETLVGDRLLPMVVERIQLSYHPRPPKLDIKGHIISVLDGVSQIGQYDIVAIDRGTADGIEIGNVLEVYQSGRRIRNTVQDSGYLHRTITLPEEKAGLLLVFRLFERVSYALVMRATGPIHVLDTVQNP